MRYIYIFIFLQAFFCATTYGQKSIKGIYPYGFYTPETSVAVGSFGYWMPHFDSSKTQKPSIVQHFITITAKKQFLIENEWFVYSKNKRWLHVGVADAIKFPEQYFGVGNTTNEKDAVMLTYNLINFNSKHLNSFHKNWFWGPHIMFYKLWNVTGEDLEKINMAASKMPEIQDYTSAGVGSVLLFDSRNHQLTPRNGSYFENEINFYLTNKRLFSQQIFDLRYYKSLSAKLIIATQCYLQLNQGDVPFRMLPAIGGGRYLRGYYRGRFRDKNMVVLQGELRYTIYKRIGATAFSGIGQVAPSLESFKTSAFHANYGFGVRYQLKKNDPANLRFDLGFTNEGLGFYLLFAESF